jgi:hypothetical protein
MPETKTERTKSFEQLNDELIALKNVNTTIEQICAELKETEKNKDREFQLRIFELQKEYDTINSFLPVAIAIGLSYVVAIVTILLTVPSLPKFASDFLGVIGIITLIIVIAILCKFRQYHKSIPSKLGEIRRDFIQNKEHETKT